MPPDAQSFLSTSVINIFANSNHELFIDWIQTEGIRRINKLKSAI